MGSKICMNTSCGAKTTVQWKPGWELKSGQRADLCFTCGSAYENLVYCDKFHLEETGWRECSMCNKRLHCGCTASVSFIQLQDFGGVCCTRCAASQSAMGNGISCEAQRSRTYATVVDVQNTLLSKLDSDDIRNKNVLSMRNIIDTNVPRYLPHSHTDSPNGSFGQIKPDVKHSLGVGVGFSNLSQALNGPPALYVKPNNDKTNAAFQDKHEPQIPSLNISLETSKFGLTFTNGVEEGEKSRSTSFQTGQRPRHILPKPPKSNISKVSDATKSPFPPNRVARPPAEGRLRNQLLPRYWPRITDQELQKLSGDLNSTIVPLFEKILSASDASRIGRLVLPKACAEAYFPPINQSEGLPLKIQDVKGKEWTFQFRFWPNNNSRMYVLEGVTNCIQSMQLQAGDTVTFSRIDPGGKLVIGYRKASNGAEMQDPQTSSPNPIGDTSGESFYSDVAEGLYMASGLTGLQTVSGEKDNCMTTVPEQSIQVNGNNTLSNTEKLKGKANEDAQQQKVTSDKKRMRNIGSKSKRLLMNSEDVMELRLTWEETQDLLRPPPCVKPNIVKVEEFEFEEYSEPPVFGKMTFFTTQPSGGQEQWAQCDKCCKWRKLPADVLLPPNWICSENMWDSSRSSCLAPEEISSNELDTVFRARKDMKKRRVAEKAEVGEGCEASGLDALARAATLGEQEEPSSGATTRHPRHRPGCTCIVCIQPPSGKGRHKPSCACNVCLTVKRRFKTLMMRKKKRQGERQAAELAQHKTHTHPPIIGCQIMNNDLIIAEKGKSLSQGECGSKGGHIDLNCHPIRDEEATLGSQPNMGMPIAQVATLPADMYMNPNGLANQNLREELHALVVTDQELDNEGAKEATTD